MTSNTPDNRKDSSLEDRCNELFTQYHDPAAQAELAVILCATNNKPLQLKIIININPVLAGSDLARIAMWGKTEELAVIALGRLLGLEPAKTRRQILEMTRDGTKHESVRAAIETHLKDMDRVNVIAFQKK